MNKLAVLLASAVVVSAAASAERPVPNGNQMKRIREGVETGRTPSVSLLRYCVDSELLKKVVTASADGDYPS